MISTSGTGRSSAPMPTAVYSAALRLSRIARRGRRPGAGDIRTRLPGAAAIRHRAGAVTGVPGVAPDHHREPVAKSLAWCQPAGPRTPALRSPRWPTIDSVQKRGPRAARSPRFLVGLLTALPEHHRVPVVLRHVVGLSYAEIASVLDCPVGTAKANVARGLDRLRALAARRARRHGRHPSRSPSPIRPSGQGGSMTAHASRRS